MKEQSSKKLFFRVQRSRVDWNYEHFYVDVFEGETPAYVDLICGFSWQTDRTHEDWYAHQVKLETSEIVRVVKTAALLKKLFGPDIEWTRMDMQPTEFCKMLESKAHAVEVFRDPRQGEFVTREQVLPIEWDAYLDDYSKWGRNYCTCRVMARDEAEARRLLTKEFASGYNDSLLDEWIEAGRPIMKITSSEPLPDLRTVEEKASLKGGDR